MLSEPNKLLLVTIVLHKVLSKQISYTAHTSYVPHNYAPVNKLAILWEPGWFCEY